MKYYTVYKITNLINGKIYIGCHQTDNLDDEYFGSGKYLWNAIEKYGKENFKKEYLQIFDNPNEMFEMEAKLVNEKFVERDDTYNLKEGGNGGWDHINVIGNNKHTVIVRNNVGKYFRISQDDPRYLAGMFKHVTDGKVIVKDNNGNREAVLLDDPRYLAGELVPIWKGLHHKENTKRKIGKKNSIHQRGKGNSQYGKCWIYNDKESIRIKKEELEEYLTKGWIKGRKIKYLKVIGP